MHDIAQAAAEAAQVPDFAAVARRGDRRRTARHGLAAGVAALTVAGVVGLSQVVAGPGDGRPQPAPSPTPTTELPSGGEPTILPYWQDGTLHVGAESIDTELRDIRHGGGTTVVGFAGYDDRSEWYLVDDSELVPIVRTEHYVSQVMVSPDGDVVAINTHLPGERHRLSLWDVASRAIIGDTVLESRAQCCDAAGELVVKSIDLDHRVFFVDRDVWMWRPGADPVEVTGLDPSRAAPSQPWPGGLMHQGRHTVGKYSPGVYGTVDDTGEFRPVGTAPTDQNGLWSPDGGTYAFVASPDDPEGYGDHGKDSVWVQHGTAEPVALPLAPDRWSPVGWESATQVVVTVQADPTGDQVLPRVERLARCDVTELACTPIEDVPTGPVVWPAAGPWAG